VSRILFVMLHPGFIRYYEGALQALADAGHDLHVAFEISRDKLGESTLATRLDAASPHITSGTAPPRSESVRDVLIRGDRTATRSGDRHQPVGRQPRREQAWESLATTVRLLLDDLRFFEPAFAQADKLRNRAEKRLPRAYVPLVRAIGRHRRARQHAVAMLHRIEQAIPTSDAVEAFVRAQRPDLLMVTPLIELGSQQVDYIKCARRLGIRSALAVASWDNLTSKGLIRVLPDHVVVWNEAQKAEAVTLHGVPPERVVITGAQVFDRWFAARPSRSRAQFCRDVGLDPDRRFVLYVGSSTFIAPDEVPFTERWLARLRASADPAVSSLGVLVRPHPANARQWRAFDTAAWPNVALWPPVGSDPNHPDFYRDYFDSLYYSAGVVGINTSAQLEAGIVGRPVFTVRAPEFAHSQDGTLHFRHLVDAEHGIVQDAPTLDAHLAQLAATLRGGSDTLAANRRFVRSFIRPFGDDVQAGPVFAQAVGALAQLPRLQRDESSSPAIGRPLVYAAARMAHTLAEDRPLWVYALRPLVTAGVWIGAAGYRTRTAIHEQVRPSLKRLRRGAQRARHEAARSLEKRWKRAQRSARRVLAAANSAARKG
jgi:hypothetical protein